MPTNPSTSKSFAHMATRMMWSAIGEDDVEVLRQAIQRGANPNDQQALNTWDPPNTPLLEACKYGSAAMIKALQEAGAKRRSSGKKSRSALAVVVHHQQSQGVDAVLDAYGKPTQTEMFEAFRAIDQGPQMSDDRADRWVDFLCTSFLDKGAKMDTGCASKVVMLWLGGEGSNMGHFPGRVEKLIEKGVLPQNPLQDIEHTPHFLEWGLELSRGNWNHEESFAALQMLHTLDFPFDVLHIKVQETKGASNTSLAWIAEQSSLFQARTMQEKTPSIERTRPSTRL